MRPITKDGARVSDLPELTNDALEAARWNPGVGCLIDRVYPGRPLIISFGFVDWESPPIFDFFGRTKKLEDRFDVKFNRILIRDLTNAWYHRGVPGLGSHVDEVAASLRGLVRSIRPGRVLTIGQSMGGYGAIMLGMLAGADRIVSFGPLSHLNLSEAICYGDRRFLPVLEGLEADRPRSGYYDLPRLGAALDYRGELHVIFGTHPGNRDDQACNLDAIHAFRLARLPHVVLHPYPEAEHAVVQWLIDHQQIDDVLASLLILDEHADQSALAGSPAPAMADSSFPVKSGAFTR